MSWSNYMVISMLNLYNVSLYATKVAICLCVFRSRIIFSIVSHTTTTTHDYNMYFDCILQFIKMFFSYFSFVPSNILVCHGIEFFSSLYYVLQLHQSIMSYKAESRNLDSTLRRHKNEVKSISMVKININCNFHTFFRCCNKN